MKKYLGSNIMAFSAIVAPLYVFAPPVLCIFMLGTEISPATIFLTLGGLLCTIVSGLYIKNISSQLYSWGIFHFTGVKIITVFSKSYELSYEKCKSCGIGYYTHGILNTKIGSKEFFIFLSYDRFDESYRTQINLWKPSKKRMKVKFNKKLYKHLFSVLPQEQSCKLQKDYKKYFETEKSA